MKKRMAVAAFSLTSVLITSSLIGCVRSNNGLQPAQQKIANRLDEIVQRTDDWGKLTKADHDYLVNEIAHGSESSARMVLQAKAGRLKTSPARTRHR